METPILTYQLPLKNATTAHLRRVLGGFGAYHPPFDREELQEALYARLDQVGIRNVRLIGTWLNDHGISGR